MTVAKSGLEEMATVNGWGIMRERIGSAVIWYCRMMDADGYRIGRSRDFPNRRDAEEWARSAVSRDLLGHR
jgi:hypothetical protein